MNESMNERTEKRKLYTPTYFVCRGYKNIHHLEIIKTNILSKFHDDHFKNVTSRASTRFSFDLAGDPVLN